MTSIRLAILVTLGAVASAQAWCQALTVSIAIPPYDQVVDREAQSHFHVVLTNVSEEPKRIWREVNSWGYFALSFEIADDTGRKWIAKKRNVTFTRNIPSWIELPAAAPLVFDVSFAKDTWEGFAEPKRGKSSFTVRAIFEVEPTPESNQHGIWTGRLESEPRRITFARWKSEGK